MSKTINFLYGNLGIDKWPLGEFEEYVKYEEIEKRKHLPPAGNLDKEYVKEGSISVFPRNLSVPTEISKTIDKVPDVSPSDGKKTETKPHISSPTLPVSNNEVKNFKETNKEVKKALKDDKTKNAIDRLKIFFGMKGGEFKGKPFFECDHKLFSKYLEGMFNEIFRLKKEENINVIIGSEICYNRKIWQDNLLKSYNIQYYPTKLKTFEHVRIDKTLLIGSWNSEYEILDNNTGKDKTIKEVQAETGEGVGIQDATLKCFGKEINIINLHNARFDTPSVFFKHFNDKFNKIKDKDNIIVIGDFNKFKFRKRLESTEAKKVSIEARKEFNKIIGDLKGLDLRNYYDNYNKECGISLSDNACFLGSNEEEFDKLKKKLEENSDENRSACKLGYIEIYTKLKDFKIDLRDDLTNCKNVVRTSSHLIILFALELIENEQ